MLNKVAVILNLWKGRDNKHAAVSFCESCGEVCDTLCRQESVYRESSELKNRYLPGVR